MVEAERVLIAAKDGDLQTLRSLRRSAPFAADGFGATALHYAARTGRMECVKWLVEAIGISPNVRGRSGATPLHDAAAQGQLECVKYFLGNGAVDVETRDGSGHTALHLAARFGRFETVKWLIERGNCNPRAKSRNHMTPVHFAASGGQLTCLELLVFKAGYGCVNDVATDGTTPLYLATQDGNLDCVKYLHSVGGKCDAKARDGMLPIHAAAQNGQLDCLGYLIESGQANLNERDTSGATPAHYAAAQGHVSVLKWLNAKGNISSIDNLGGSPLHDAAEQGQFECVRYLVENADLDVNKTDEEGLTPLALAEKNGHRRCIDYLKIAASKQAKAQKRHELETKRQHFEKDSNKFATSSSMSTVKIQAKRDFPSVNLPSKESFPILKEPSEQTSKHQSVANSKNNDIEEGGDTKRQSRRYSASENPATQESSVVQRELPAKQTSKQHTAANNNNKNSSNNKDNITNPSNNNSRRNATNNNDNRNDRNRKGEPAKASTADSSSFTAPPNPRTTESLLHSTQESKTTVSASSPPVRPLRERQLQPLPHFGDIIPPPLEFSESSDSSDVFSEKLKPVKENFTIGEENMREKTHLSGLFESSGSNHYVGVEEADNYSITVEVHSLEDKSGSRRIPRSGMKSEPCGDKSHVISTRRRHGRIDQSVSEEFGSNPPPWKNQILVNRKLKEKAREKAEREKREIEERKWNAVPPWKIPLLAKKEEERLKEEQRWVGMPEWKKNLLSRRGTGQIYRDYHAVNSGNFRRRTMSAEPHIASQNIECDYFTRPRGMSSLN